MTDIHARVRAVAAQLPEAEEHGDADALRFTVDGRDFARVVGGRLTVLAAEGDWDQLDTDGDPDWALVEDRVAQAWELAAPDRLLEAGGR